MSHASCATAVLGAIARPRGRPRKTASPLPRFASIRLADAAGGGVGDAALDADFEILFPDGLRLRIARGADPAALERILHPLRRPGR
jgi:hypothetical protein